MSLVAVRDVAWDDGICFVRLSSNRNAPRGLSSHLSLIFSYHSRRLETRPALEEHNVCVTPESCMYNPCNVAPKRPGSGSRAGDGWTWRGSKA